MTPRARSMAFFSSAVRCVEDINLVPRRPEDIAAGQHAAAVAGFLLAVGPDVPEPAALLACEADPVEPPPAGDQAIAGDAQQLRRVLQCRSARASGRCAASRRRSRLSAGATSSVPRSQRHGVRSRCQCGRRLAQVAVPRTGIEADPEHPASAVGEGGHGAEIRVVIERVAMEREQVVRALMEEAAGRGLRAADEPPPAQPAGLGIETGHVGLRADVVAAHGHVHARRSASGEPSKAQPSSAAVFHSSLPFRLQVETDQITAAGADEGCGGRLVTGVPMRA